MMTNYNRQSNIAEDDNIIREIINDAAEKEKKIIKNYLDLIKLKNSLEEKNATLTLKKINDELEKTKKLLFYKKKSKQEQCSAILKLLEYLNTINKKEKQLDMEKLKLKHDLIEKELLINYKDI